MAPAGIGRRVEGVHAVAAAVAAGRVERLIVERRRRGDLVEVLTAVPDGRVEEVERISDAVTENPQGVVALCRPIPTHPVEELVGSEAALIVLDRITDPHNIGAIARSAAAAGAAGMVLASRRAGPLSATAFKAAAGALEHLPVAIVTSVAAAVDRVKAAGVWVVGLDSSGTTSIFGLDLLAEPVALVVGAEGTGLSRLVRERCDVVARIPMAASSDSLNASVAAALGLFEVARVRKRLS